MSEYANISPQKKAAVADNAALRQAVIEPGCKDIFSITAQRLPIQRKLSIGAVDDPLEHEADAMADTVMRMPQQNFIQRKCSHCEEEEAQRKPLASFIQKKESGTNNITSDSVNSQIQSTRGGGSAMPDNTKSFMESRFGTDFSDVRIHSGAYASQLSGELNAQAFTVGNDIYFNEGKFSPESFNGKHLLVHELTHTVQQGSGKQLLQRTPGKYDTLSIEDLKKAAVADPEAAEALRLKYRAMSTRELAKLAKNGDALAESIYADRNVVPAAAKGQGRFSDAGIQDQLALDVESGRVASGVTREAPSVLNNITKTEGGTVGAARTNIPGLESRVFRGASTRAGGQLNPESNFPPATDVEVLPQTHGHAEQAIADEIEIALSKIPKDQLKGRTIWMLIEQTPCSTCAQGVRNAAVEAGVLKKLSQAFPEVTFEIKSLENSALIVLKNGAPPVTGGAGAAVPENPAEAGAGNTTPVNVDTKINVIKSSPGANGSTVSEIEYLFGESLEHINKGAPSGASLPSRIVIRVTQNAEGAITAVESLTNQPQALVEALAQSTLPKLASGAAAEGAAGTAVASSGKGFARLSKGLKIGGWAAFVVITGYQLYKATPAQRPRVLAQAGGGLAGGALGSYLVCNLALDIETAGWGLLICAFVAGGVGGYAGSELAGDVYDEATRTALSDQLKKLDARSEPVKILFNALVSDAKGTPYPYGPDFVRNYLRVVPNNLGESELILVLGKISLTDSFQTRKQKIGTLGPLQPAPHFKQDIVCPNCHRSNADQKEQNLRFLTDEQYNDILNAPSIESILTGRLQTLKAAISQLPGRYITTFSQPVVGADEKPVHPPFVENDHVKYLKTVCPNCHSAVKNNAADTKTPLFSSVTETDRQAVAAWVTSTIKSGSSAGAAGVHNGAIAPTHTGLPLGTQAGTVCPNCHATIDSNADKFPALKGTGTFNNLTPEQQQQLLDFIKK